MMTRVKFNDTPRVVVYDGGYPKETYDRDGSVIPMRMHRSRTYQRIIVGKYYHDFLKMVSLNDPWAPGMYEFSNQIYNNISILTQSKSIDIFLSNQDMLYKYFFNDKISINDLIDSIYLIMQKQTLFLYYNQNVLRREVSNFLKLLYENSYCYKKFCISAGNLSCTEIYELLTKMLKMYFSHPDLVV